MYITISFVCHLSGSLGDMKVDMANARSREVKNLGIGRSSHSSMDNGRFWFGNFVFSILVWESVFGICFVF